jgi:hypothetical protein
MRAVQLSRWCARLAVVSAFSAAAVAFAAGAASADTQLGGQEAGGVTTGWSVTCDETDWGAPEETDWGMAPVETDWGRASLETDWG